MKWKLLLLKTGFASRLFIMTSPDAPGASSNNSYTIPGQPVPVYFKQLVEYNIVAVLAQIVSTFDRVSDVWTIRRCWCCCHKTFKYFFKNLWQRLKRLPSWFPNLRFIGVVCCYCCYCSTSSSSSCVCFLFPSFYTSHGVNYCCLWENVKVTAQ